MVSSGLGASSTYFHPESYSDYRAALVSHATTADDTTALAHLPNSANNPVNNNSDVDLTLPLARALGFSADTPVGDTDGTIYLKTSVMNLSAAQNDPNKFSLFAVVSHEIDEVLGFASALNNLNNGDSPPTDPVSPEDLFRYDQNGARSFTTDLNAASYFSLDGTTHLARFNQHAVGDFSDWYSYYGGQTPQVQDAYSTPGAAPVLGVELRALDAIGYHRVVVIEIDQTITFGPLDNKSYGEPPFAVSATASSGLSVNFSILSGPATISGNTVTLTGIGTVTLRASQAGDTTYNPAPNVDRTFTVYGPPTLSINKSGTNWLLSWPTNVAAFVLQSANNLNPVIPWSAVTPGPSVVNGQYTVTNSTSGTHFYRLRK
jgi:hypothetical protein